MAEPTSAAQTPNDQPTVASAGAPDPIGTHGAPLGVVLGGELGEGGMGIVYEATDTELAREQNGPAATAAFERAAELDDKYAAVHHNLGVVYFGAGRYDAAVDAFGRALALDPLDADALSMLGIGYKFRDDPRAAPYLAAAACLSPDNANRFLTLGGVLRNANDLPGAIEAFRRAVTLDPFSADAQFQLGDALEAVGALAEAERASRDAARLNEAEFGALLKRLPLISAPKD